MNKTIKLALLGSALALTAGPASAVDLCAGSFTKTLPDGNPVTMWGYADGGATAGVCDNTPSSPGPQLTVPDTDTILTINLTNTLPESTSLVIPGLPMPAGGPTWDDDSSGSRCANMTEYPNNCTAGEVSAGALDKRVRSFGVETASGASGVYTFTVDRPGTFLYHSGTHPQKQVYMGLSGAVTRDSAPGVAYPAIGTAPAVAYSKEVVLFYSEIDPEHNAAVAGGTYETSIHYHAKWFLVNGEPYSTICTDDGGGSDVASGYPCASMVQTAEIAAGAAKSPTLLRFLSTAGETHVPTLQGLHMTIHAEDGIQYGWEDTDPAATVPSGTAPREQYSVMLPPLKTKDAIIEPQLEGTYALYDGNGYMTNPTDPADFDHADPVGGMLRFLSVGTNGGVNLPPIVADDPDAPAVITAVQGRTITIDVLANDSDPEGQPLTIDSVDATGLVGTLICDTVNPGGTCSYTADGGVGVTSFTYAASDGIQTSVLPDAIVTITVNANAAPVAVDDADTTDVNTQVVVNVLANDTDANGDTLTIASVDTTGTVGTVACDNATGDCTYTPNGVFTGDDTFTYKATDGDVDSDPATVTVDVTAAPDNSAPVAVDNAYDVVEDAILNVAAPGVLINDADADGDALTAVLDTLPSNYRTDTGFVFNTDGSFRYEPAVNFSGTDSFTYYANDGVPPPDGTNSNTVTVTISVSPQEEFPVAEADEYFLKSMDPVVLSVVAPGVLGNDTPSTGLTAVLVNTTVNPPATLTLNADGSFDYTGDPGNNGVGTLDSFIYEAQGATATSAPAVVTLTRKLAVRQAVCEPRNNGRCNWVIEGDKLDNARQSVEAYFGGTLIGSTNARAGAWTISARNSQVNPGLGPINVRVVGDADAEILSFPTQ